jgi:hypothetical protein
LLFRAAEMLDFFEQFRQLPALSAELLDFLEQFRRMSPEPI